jgi:hypothetical protein
MAVFEIATGRWISALPRFEHHILPTVSAGDAYQEARWRAEGTSVFASQRAA